MNYNSKEVAELLGCSVRKVQRLAKEGVLNCVKEKVGYSFLEKDVLLYIKSNLEDINNNKLLKVNKANGKDVVKRSLAQVGLSKIKKVTNKVKVCCNPSIKEEPEFISPKEASTLLHISISTLKRYRVRGELKRFELRGNKGYFYDKSEVEALSVQKGVDKKLFTDNTGRIDPSQKSKLSLPEIIDDNVVNLNLSFCDKNKAELELNLITYFSRIGQDLGKYLVTNDLKLSNKQLSTAYANSVVAKILPVILDRIVKLGSDITLEDYKRFAIKMTQLEEKEVVLHSWLKEAEADLKANATRFKPRPVEYADKVDKLKARIKRLEFNKAIYKNALISE